MADANPSPRPAPGRGRQGLPKPRVDRAARRELILRSAAETFAEFGLQRATMQDIADRAGMAKILIYRLFPSKEALAAALFERVLDRLKAAAAEPWTGYGSGQMRLLNEARQDRAAFLLLLRDGRADPEARRWCDAYQDLLAGFVYPLLAPAAGSDAQAEDRARVAARQFTGFITETLIVWLEDGDGLSDAARVKWVGDIIRNWRRATREAYRLDGGG